MLHTKVMNINSKDNFLLCFFTMDFNEKVPRVLFRGTSAAFSFALQ